MNNSVTVKVIDLEHGLRLYKDVILVRIKDKSYNLLVMKDYTPIIGKIVGNVDIETKDKKEHFENIEGYFINQNNIFSLILDEKDENK